MPAHSDRNRVVVAAFDVDGTLTRHDNVGSYLFRTARMRLPLALVRRPVDLVRGLVGRDHDLVKDLACRSLAGTSIERSAAVGEALAEEIVTRRLRGDVAARLRRHQDLGHVTVLVSASLEPYLLPLGRRLGTDGVLCTRLEVDADGRLTGRLDGANCRGAEKERRLRAWLGERRLEHAELWAYGDSRGDDELLAMADHGVLVRGVQLRPDPVA